MAPFDDTSSTAVHPFTLQRTIELVEADSGLADSRKRDLISAIRGFARHLGLPVETAAAGLLPHRQALHQFAPAAVGISAKTWSNILSGAKFAFRYGGATSAAEVRRPRPSDLAPAWRTLRERLAVNIRLARGLTRLIYFSSARGIDPEQVNDAILHAFWRYLAEESLEKEPNSIYRQTCRYWNNAAETISGWPQTLLTIPSFRSRVSFSWAHFPASFREELAEWGRVMSGATPFHDRAPQSSLRPQTIGTRTEQLKRLASALVHSGRLPIERVTGLATLVEPENFEAAHLWYRAHHGGKWTPSVYEMAYTALLVARHWVKLDKASVKRLERATARMRCREKGMTDKNCDRVQLLLEPANQRKLMLLPDRLIAEARRQKNPKKAALQWQTAIAIEILLVAPIRLGNLVRLDADAHFRFARPGWRAPRRLRVNPDEVKNRFRLNFELEGETAAKIERYLHQLRALVPGAAPNTGTGRLFPGARGRAHKTEVALRDQIKAAILRHTGLVVNPHLFRHFAAVLYLDEHPGEYATVAMFLGHKSVQTTIDFYAPFESTAAARLYYARVLAPRRGSPSGVRRQPSERAVP